MNSSPKKPPELRLTIQRATRTPTMPAARLIRHWLKQALASLAPLQSLPQSVEMTVRIVGTHEARQLNSEYRGKDYATNILTFPYGETDGCLGGDLVLAATIVADEASQQSKLLEAHFAHLLIHGLLHMLGYDHESDEEAAIMEPIEIQLMHKLGFPDPYATR